MHVHIIIQSSFCVLNLMLPAQRQNFSEVPAPRKWLSRPAAGASHRFKLFGEEEEKKGVEENF
jgi:hypothetical protein